MVKPLYTAQARVVGDRTNGRGRTAEGSLELNLALPREMGGDGGGVNPEQLFAIGYAACFSTVIGMLGQRRKLDVGQPVIDSSVMLVPIGNGRYKLGVELDVSLPGIRDEGQALQLVRDAHEVCPYSNTTRGNIDVALVVNGLRV